MSDERGDRSSENLPETVDDQNDTRANLPETADSDSSTSDDSGGDAGNSDEYEAGGNGHGDEHEGGAGGSEKNAGAADDTASETDRETTSGTDRETTASETAGETTASEVDGETTASADGTIADGRDSDLPAQDLARVFAVLEEAFTSDTLGTSQFDQLLTVLERTVAVPEETDPETVAELISMLEELIVEPDDIDEVDVERMLSVFEEAIPGIDVDQADVAAVFDVVEAAIRDPASIDPDDVEQFRSGIERTVLNMTDPESGGFGLLFPLAEMGRADRPDSIEEEDIDLFRLARITAGLTQRATDHSIESGIRTGTRMAYAAANSQSPVELVTSARAIALDELQRSGVDIGDEQETWLATHEEDVVDTRPITRERLEERGAALLEQSAEIGRDESLHPSFPLILDQLAPDEARILRLLATEGPQCALDIYDRQYIPFRLRLVAENLTMLGTDAGCRNKLRTALYLQNLRRLGLLQVVDEPVETLKSYQILESQAHIEQARERAKRPKMVYKRVELTDLGVEFCEQCFPFSVAVDSAGRSLRREANDQS